LGRPSLPPDLGPSQSPPPAAKETKRKRANKNAPSMSSNRQSLIRLKRIYNFLCSMLIYTPFALCFVTLRGIFMHFPELTLLTRCHSASSCFYCFCVSEKLHRKYSRNWTKQKPKFLFFPNRDRVQR
jgi:hypothetical protein